MLVDMEALHRPDDRELCGFVDEHGGQWRALTVFGAVLGVHDERQRAVEQVLADGLASLAERWTLRSSATGEDEVVCIQEANAHAVTVALGYSSVPGVPTLRITREQLAAGEWVLAR
jgi:hypothetical protein